MINRSKNRKYRLNGIWPSIRLPFKERLCRAFRDHLIYGAGELPAKTDLRPHMSPIEDQSKIGSW